MNVDLTIEPLNITVPSKRIRSGKREIKLLTVSITLGRAFDVHILRVQKRLGNCSLFGFGLWVLEGEIVILFRLFWKNFDLIEFKR